MNKQPACAATPVVFYYAFLLLNAPEHLFRYIGWPFSSLDVIVLHIVCSFKTHTIHCLSCGACCSCLLQSGRQVCLLEVLSFSLGAILEYLWLITVITLLRNPISFHSRRSVQISPLFIFGDASGMWASLSCTPVRVQILNQNCVHGFLFRYFNMQAKLIVSSPQTFARVL